MNQLNTLNQEKMDYNAQMTGELPFGFRVHTHVEGVGVEMHCHEEIEIGFKLYGNPHKIRIEDQEHEVERQDIFVVNSQAKHSLVLPEDEHRVCLSLTIPVDFLKSYGIYLNQVDFYLNGQSEISQGQKESYHKMVILFEKFMLLLRDSKPSKHYSMVYISIVLEIFYILLQDFTKNNN